MASLINNPNWDFTKSYEENTKKTTKPDLLSKVDATGVEPAYSNVGVVENGTIKTTVVQGGSSGGSSVPSQPIGYSSSVLGMSFGSKEAMQQAEAQYYAKKQAEQQKQYDLSGGVSLIGGTTNRQTSVVQLEDYQGKRVQELKQAGFSEEDIKVLTSPSGSRYSYYSGKVVPQTNQQKAFYERADVQAKDIEKRASTTAAAVGVATLGLGAAPFFAGIGGLAGTVGVIGSNVLGGFGLIETGKSTAGLNRPSSGKTVTQKEQGEIIRETESRIEEQYNKEGFQIPYIGSTTNIMYGFPGSKVLSEVVQGSQKQKTGLDTFEDISKQVLKERGYTEDEAKVNAKYLRGISYGGDVGSVASLFPFGGIGEYGVRTGVQEATKVGTPFLTKEAAAKSVKEAAKRAATFPAAIEGVSMYVGQQYARDKEVKPEGIVLSGVLSGVTGRYGAGWIAEKSITNPKLANVVYKGLWVVQPDEPAGDFFADAIMKTAGRRTDTTVKYFTPTVSISPSVSSSTKQPYSGLAEFSTGQSIYTPTVTQQIGTKAKGVSNTLVDLINNDNSIYSKSNTGTLTDTSTQTSSSTKSDSTSITNTINNTYNNELTWAATQTSTETATNTATATATLAYSSNLPFLPIGGLGLGGGGSPFGGAKGTARQRKKYYDEFGAAVGILGESQRYGQSMWTRTPFKTNNQLARAQQRKQVKLLKKELKKVKSKKFSNNSKNIFNPSKNFRSGFL